MKSEAEDEIRDEPLPEPSDLLSGEDAFPEAAEPDEDDGADEPAGLWRGLPGPLIAAATFAPTFVVVFFGLSALLGGGAPTGPAANAGMSSTALRDPGIQPTPPSSEGLRDSFGGPKTLDPAPLSRPSDPREVVRGPTVDDAPVPAIDSSRPTLPPGTPAESRATRPPEPSQQPQAAVLNITPERTPAAEPRKSGREWAPAAAFADREAANRLASSIQQQGYPVEVRQEQSASRPWVVWIGAQPRGGDRRR